MSPVITGLIKGILLAVVALAFVGAIALVLDGKDRDRSLPEQIQSTTTYE